MKTVKIDFGGVLKKPLLARMGTMAFISIEEIAGKSMQDIDMNSVASMFIFLTASLKWKKPSITLDEVMGYMDKWAEKLAKDNNVSFMEGLSLAMEELAPIVQELMGVDDETPTENEG